MRLAILLVAILAASAPAQERFLAIEDLYRNETWQGPLVVPRGPLFIRHWIDSETKLERSAFYLRSKAGEIAQVEPYNPDARAPLLSPDGKWIAFLSTRPRPNGWDQIPATPPQSDVATDLWLLPSAGGSPIPLAPARKPYGRVFNDPFYGRVAFSPDSSKLVFVADDGKDPRTEAERTNDVQVVRPDGGEGYTGYGNAQVWVATLAKEPGEHAATSIERLTNDSVWYGDPQWSPDGKTIVVHANRSDDREAVRYSINKDYNLFSIDVSTKEIRQLTDGPGVEVSPRFSPDGKRLVCLSCPRKGPHADVFNLAVIDLEGNEKKLRVLFDHHGPGEPPHPRPSFPLPANCWSDDGRLRYSSDRGMETFSAIVNVDTAKGERVSPGKDKTLADRPPPNPMLTGVTLGKQSVISWKSTDGLEIEGVLTLPASSSVKPPHKLIVYPHGGPHSKSRPGFDFTVQTFAARGYAVFQPNFRGSAGYGLKFLDADRNDLGGADMQDILTGVDKLIADGIADKDHLFVYGISYGGYSTVSLVGQTTRFRAACAQNAVTDLNMMWSLSDIQSWTEWEFGGKPWEVPDKMRKHSPITSVDRVKTPTLILHSRDDRRCPLPMGQAYHQALKARGVPTELVIYPDEGHGIRQPRHREDVLRRVLAWFEKYEKGSP